jgi:hypothetical protein
MKTMNHKFYTLTKGLAESVTRRAALKKIGVGLAGIALASFGLANKAQAGTPLDITAEGGGVVISLPGSTTGQVIESCTNLNGLGWLPVSGVVSNRLTLGAQQLQQQCFYRAVDERTALNDLAAESFRRFYGTTFDPEKTQILSGTNLQTWMDLNNPMGTNTPCSILLYLATPNAVALRLSDGIPPGTGLPGNTPPGPEMIFVSIPQTIIDLGCGDRFNGFFLNNSACTLRNCGGMYGGVGGAHCVCHCNNSCDTSFDCTDCL